MSFASDLHSNGKSCLIQRKRGTQLSDKGKATRENMVPKIVSGGYAPVDDENEVLTHRTDMTSNGTTFLEKDESHSAENGLLLNENHAKIIDFEAETKKRVGESETSFTIASQVVIPFLIAGLGTVAAGLLLDKVQVYVEKMVKFCDCLI